MFKRVDESERLSNFILRISTALAARRGLPMIVGVGIILVSGLCWGLILPLLVVLDEIASGWLLLCLPLFLFYLGLLIALIGIMLAVPLGEGYRDQT